MMQEIVDRVGTCNVISKMDLIKGYYQVLVTEKDQEKSGCISPYGKYQFRRVPFGLRNAPAMFQKLMERVLVNCRGFAETYINTLLMYLKEWRSI